MQSKIFLSQTRRRKHTEKVEYLKNNQNCSREPTLLAQWSQRLTRYRLGLRSVVCRHYSTSTKLLGQSWSRFMSCIVGVGIDYKDDIRAQLWLAMVTIFISMVVKPWLTSFREIFFEIMKHVFCLFDLILYVPTTIFQL